MLDLEKIRAGLVAKGYTPMEGPSPNGFGFMFEGGSYYLDLDISDENYIRVGFPNFFTVKPENHLLALKAANKVTESMKAVKVYLIDNQVYCSVEQFVRNEEDVTYFLMRYLRTLQGGTRYFLEQLSKG
jgi:hypothetical protein